MYNKFNKSFEQNCSFIIIAAMLDFLYNYIIHTSNKYFVLINKDLHILYLHIYRILSHNQMLYSGLYYLLVGVTPLVEAVVSNRGFFGGV